MSFNLAIYIATAVGWDDRRKAPLDRLLKQLHPSVKGLEDLVDSSRPDSQYYAVGPRNMIISSKEKEHSRVWATRMYECAARSSDSTHHLFLNDDDLLCPGFIDIVNAMIEAVPDQVISLHSVCPQTTQVKSVRWLQSYLLSGPAYLYPREDLIDLLRFIEALPKSIRDIANEDEVGAHHAFSRQKPIWQSIPALVEHDTSVPSTLGYDNHPMRQSLASFSWYAREHNFSQADLAEFLSHSSAWRTSIEPDHVPHPWLGVNAMHEVRRIIQGEPDMRICVFCREALGCCGHHKTGAKICLKCGKDITATFHGIAMQKLTAL